jgi:hypothetical protein
MMAEHVNNGTLRACLSVNEESASITQLLQKQRHDM